MYPGHILYTYLVLTLVIFSIIHVNTLPNDELHGTTQSSSHHTLPLNNGEENGLPWTLNPTTTLANLLLKYSTMVTPLPILTSLLKLLPWASTEMHQAIHMLFPTLNFTSPYLENPEALFSIDQLKYVQIGSREATFLKDFDWGSVKKTPPEQMIHQKNAWYSLETEFLKVFYPNSPTKQCYFLNVKRKRKAQYWLLDTSIFVYQDKKGFDYIPIPLSNQSTMYVIPSKKAIPLNDLMSIHLRQPKSSFQVPRLAVPLIHAQNVTNLQLLDLLNVNPSLTNMTKVPRQLTKLRQKTSIQLTSGLGIRVQSFSCLGNFDNCDYSLQTPLMFNLDPHCNNSRYQLEPPFHILIQHSITQAVYFLGYIQH
ncbi:hypothetical protein HMI54_015761 [Coelomomyces lativittatus]|nr:hypothetical protein HMI56_007364 [Coelomomyces lativittatus]KAJ1512365.1 hypothetical protein HMI54_015761 [Coelomomyces lativittatus]KAJ1515494.1 hypothetical protein HMI55_003650 [Coelomomyces lativittatus]